jgi:hypothetical protein
MRTRVESRMRLLDQAPARANRPARPRTSSARKARDHAPVRNKDLGKKLSERKDAEDWAGF